MPGTSVLGVQVHVPRISDHLNYLHRCAGSKTTFTQGAYVMPPKLESPKATAVTNASHLLILQQDADHCGDEAQAKFEFICSKFCWLVTQ